jgi:FHA domain-containing protein
MQTSDSGDPLARHSLSAAELKSVIAAEREERPFLAYRDQFGLLRLFVVPASGETSTLGRSADAELALPWDGEVSSVHAEMVVRGGELTMIDDGLSKNGTYVNGKRLFGRHRLRSDDRIRVGHTVLVYRSGPENGVLSTVTATEGRPPELTAAQRRVLVALARPTLDPAAGAIPATNRQIAAEIHLGIETVKSHLRVLFLLFGLAELPQSRKRVALVEAAMRSGAITTQELLG